MATRKRTRFSRLPCALSLLGALLAAPGCLGGQTGDPTSAGSNCEPGQWYEPDELTPLGFSPRQVLDRVEGRYAGVLDASDRSFGEELPFLPELPANVALTVESADGPARARKCPDALEIPARFELQFEGLTLSHSGTITGTPESARFAAMIAPDGGAPLVVEVRFEPAGTSLILINANGDQATATLTRETP